MLIRDAVGVTVAAKGESQNWTLTAFSSRKLLDSSDEWKHSRYFKCINYETQDEEMALVSTKTDRLMKNEIRSLRFIAQPKRVAAYLRCKDCAVKHLGIPTYLGDGEFTSGGGNAYLFLLKRMRQLHHYSTLSYSKEWNAEILTDVYMGCLNVLEYIHSKKYVHGCVMPRNIFLRGSSRGRMKVMLDDYSYSEKVVGDLNETKRRDELDFRNFSTDKEMLIFCSLDVNSSMIPSMRGDLQSLLYSLIYACTGSLPWMHVSGKNDVYKLKDSYSRTPSGWITWLHKRTKNAKNLLMTTLNLEEILTLIYSLQYGDRVDFDLLRNMINPLHKRDKGISAAKRSTYIPPSRWDFEPSDFEEEEEEEAEEQEEEEDDEPGGIELYLGPSIGPNRYKPISVNISMKRSSVGGSKRAAGSLHGKIKRPRIAPKKKVRFDLSGITYIDPSVDTDHLGSVIKTTLIRKSIR